MQPHSSASVEEGGLAANAPTRLLEARREKKRA
jgi:hypothetical protein